MKTKVNRFIRWNGGAIPVAGVLLVLAAGAAVGLQSSATSVQFWTVTAPVGMHSTFNSHNTKVIPFNSGALIAYTVTRTRTGRGNSYRVSYLDPALRIETPLVEDTSSTNAPCLVRTGDDRIAVFVNDLHRKLVTLDLYRINAASMTAKRERRNEVQGDVFNKFACLIAGDRLLFVGNDGVLRTFSPQGDLLSARVLFQRYGSRHVSAHYPHLLLSNGTLHFALTTARRNDAGRIGYWSILYFQSRDYGVTWQDRFGRELSLPLSIDYDQRVSVIRPHELPDNTWLSGMTILGQNIVFAYTTNGHPESATDKTRHPLEIVLRLARLDQPGDPHEPPRLVPIPEGVKRTMQSGFFSTQGDGDGRTAYFTTFNRDEVLVLKTQDGGATWSLHARGTAPADCPYAVDGLRKPTPDGRVLGMFTDRGPGCVSHQTYVNKSKLMALEIKL